MEDGVQTSESNKQTSDLLIGCEDVKLQDRILLSPYTKFLLPSLLIAFILPFTVHALITSRYVSLDNFSSSTCNLKTEYRVDCLPGKIFTENQCNIVHCCWNEEENICYHAVPSRHGYTPKGGFYYKGVTLIPRETNSPLGSVNKPELFVDIKAVGKDQVEISISSASLTKRIKRQGYRIDVENPANLGQDNLGKEDGLSEKLLHFLPRHRSRRTVQIEFDDLTNLKAYVHYPEFSVTVARNDFTVDEGSSIFSTAWGPLIMTETYWEWTFHVSNGGTLYGLNDVEINGTTNSIYNNENGTITPAFIAISKTGRFGSAYYVEYEGPLEVQVLNASNLVILRGMAFPETLNIHVFGGPSPLEAVQQLTKALQTGYRFPPHSNYGLHVCPEGQIDDLEGAIKDLEVDIISMNATETPWDSHCMHNAIASVLNHTMNSVHLENMKGAINALEITGRSFFPHLSPMIPAEDGGLSSALENGGLLLKAGSSPYFGVYQKLSVVYPDWRNSGVSDTAANYLIDYLRDSGTPGTLWLRDAWPKDEILNTSYKLEIDFSVFDYMPDALEVEMNNMTVPFNLTTSNSKSHHVTHNGYSNGFRSFVRSSIPTVEFLGPPGEAGNTSWSGLRRAVKSAVGAGLVGQIPPPIYVCGRGEYNSSLHGELCIRWYQAAITWPHIVVLPDKFPGGLNLSVSSSLNIVKALNLRAALASYQHTAMASHFVRGSPVLAPTAFYYPESSNFTHAWDQFIWGDGILVGLVTLPGVHQVAMRLPGHNSWRHLRGGAEAVPTLNGTTPITANIGEAILLVRPGHIIPVHNEVAQTTVETMLNNFDLLVNYDNEPTRDSAHGEIYYGLEAGEFLSLEVNGTHLILDNVLNSVQNYVCQPSTSSKTTSAFIQSVQILGNSTHRIDLDMCNVNVNEFVISL